MGIPRRILNIHPALLPSFPGEDAQRQALEHGVKFTGCTVHLVNEGMDTGPIVCQAVVPVQDDDTAETLAARILAEEHRIYSEAICLLLEDKVRVRGPARAARRFEPWRPGQNKSDTLSCVIHMAAKTRVNITVDLRLSDWLTGWRVPERFHAARFCGKGYMPWQRTKQINSRRRSAATASAAPRKRWIGWPTSRGLASRKNLACGERPLAGARERLMGNPATPPFLILDTSVVLKWFREKGEADVAEARNLREAFLLAALRTGRSGPFAA